MDIEKCPLLVEVVGGESGAGVTVGRIKSRGRGRALARGAAALIDKWPDNLSRCWLTTLLISLSLLGMCVTMNALAQRPFALRIEEHVTPLTIMLDQGASKPQQTSTHASIVSRENKIYYTEISCHLFINPGNIFSISKYFKYIALLTLTYPTYRFNIYLLNNDTVKHAYDNKIPVSFWELIESDLYDSLRQSYDLTLNEEIMRFSAKYDKVHFIKINLSEYFEGSPLQRTWFRISPTIIPFLTRVSSVWEKGGISFDLDSFIKDKSSYKNKEQVYDLLDSYLSEKIFKQPMKQDLNHVDSVITNRRLKRIYGGKHRISKRANPVLFFEDSLLYKVPIYSEMMVFYMVSNTSIPSENIISSSPLLSGSRHTINTNIINTSKKIQYPLLTKNHYDRHFEVPFLKRKIPHVKKRDLISTFTARGDESVVTLSRNGDIVAARAQCHAFLAQIFSSSQGKTMPQSPEELIEQAISIFCNAASSSQFNKCAGVSILS